MEANRRAASERDPRQVGPHLRRDEVGAHPRTAGRPAVARVGEPAIGARLLQPGRRRPAALLRRRAGRAHLRVARRPRAGRARGAAHGAPSTNIRRRRRGSSCAEGVHEQLLEVGDQLLRLGEQAAAVEQSRPHAGLNALDERPVLGSDLVVEREQILDPLLARVRQRRSSPGSDTSARGRAGSRARWTGSGVRASR